MSIAGSRVAIVGGSIAGCAAAIALWRAGCAVTVFERSQGVLRDRGAGLAIPSAMRDDLVAAGYISPAMRVRPCSAIEWIVGDGHDEVGRFMLRQDFDAVYLNWGVLWRALREGVADADYRESTAVRDIEFDADGVHVVTDHGRERFDLVVGADGYRSVVRRFVDAAASPGYVGYALWRGTYPESRLSPAQRIGGDIGLFIGFPHGHGGFYLIPGFDGNQNLLNWAIYDAISVFPWGDEPTSLPPGSVDDELAAALDVLLTERYPRRWADLVRMTGREELSVQPVYDMPITSYVGDRALMIGDAATVVRPHTASGATKAMQDALDLEAAARDGDSWDAALARYNEKRCAIGNSLVDLGRRLGRARVEETPDWTTMSLPAFRTWMDEASGAAFIPRYGS